MQTNLGKYDVNRHARGNSDGNKVKLDPKKKFLKYATDEEEKEARLGEVCIHTYIHTYMFTYTHAYIHTYLLTHVHAYMHTYIHM